MNFLNMSTSASTHCFVSLARSLAVLAAAVATAGAAIAQIEEPSFDVIKSEAPFELRQYRNFIVAEVMVKGGMDQASSEGFRLIAGYIFGGNVSVGAGKAGSVSEKIAMTAPVTLERMADKPADKSNEKTSEKIAMTAPVTLERAGAELYRVHFVMPAKYTLQNLPKPLNDRVTLREVTGQKMAVVRFSGFSTDEKVSAQTASLERWMLDQGLKSAGTAQFARYDPPIVPPFLRRSEAMIPVQ